VKVAARYPPLLPGKRHPLHAKAITTEGESRMAQQRRKNGDASTAGSLAKRMKAPAIVGGAAVAGLAGGVALGRRGSRSATANMAEAAKQIGSFGEKVGDLATEVRMVREGVAHSQRRSPVEVLLEGLTSRRA